MKNLLSLLGTIVVGSTVISPNIFFNSVSEKNLRQDDNHINLDVPIIRQEALNYCVPACIQMVFRYFDVSLNHYSQHRIFEELHGTPDGIIVTEHVSDYLNVHIPTETNYNYNSLPVGYSRTQYEQYLFQDYVYNSLFNNHPVFLCFFPFWSPNTYHAVIISGIMIDRENPELTQYMIIDPLDGSIGVNFAGEINQTLIWSAEIIGYGFLYDDPVRSDLDIVIDPHEVDRNDINDYDDHQVLDLRTDLTSTMGITQTGQFSNLFSRVMLDDFNGEIYNFTWRKPVRNFSLNIDNIPENGDSWYSPKTVIANSSEDIGSAHIEGRILAQLHFERTQSLSHLLVHLLIYVGGISWATQNWAHIWFQTGDILSFINTNKF